MWNYCKIMTLMASCWCMWRSIQHNNTTPLSLFLFHHWANRVKYVLPNISKCSLAFSLKLFTATGWTSYFVVKETKRGFRLNFGTYMAPLKWPGRRRQAPPRLRPRRVLYIYLFHCYSEVKSSQVAFNENVANAQTYKRMWKKYDKVHYNVTITY